MVLTNQIIIDTNLKQYYILIINVTYLSFFNTIIIIKIKKYMKCFFI